MSNLNKLSDLELLNHTQKAAKNEKAATLVLLDHLLLVDQRRAYATQSYSSLFDYLARGLGYSETQSAERVAAVRLMRARPEVKKHLTEGELTLTSAALIQRHLVAEKKLNAPLPAKEAQTLIQECLGQSKRVVEKILLTHASEPVQMAAKEKLRPITEEYSELKVVIDEETRALLKRAKELSQAQETADLLKSALKGHIEQLEKRLGKDPTLPAKLEEVVKSKSDPYSRYVPIGFKRAIYQRSNGQCEWSSKLGDRCKSRSHLHLDHIIPLAVGGKTELKNLRHLCPAHNQKAAQVAGIEFVLGNN
jgi:5-methylcytosine-specific restriction endonuclease McrA